MLLPTPYWGGRLAGRLICGVGTLVGSFSGGWGSWFTKLRRPNSSGVFFFRGTAFGRNFILRAHCLVAFIQGFFFEGLNSVRLLEYGLLFGGFLSEGLCWAAYWTVAFLQGPFFSRRFFGHRLLLRGFLSWGLCWGPVFCNPSIVLLSVPQKMHAPTKLSSHVANR